MQHRVLQHWLEELQGILHIRRTVGRLEEQRGQGERRGMQVRGDPRGSPYLNYHPTITIALYNTSRLYIHVYGIIILYLKVETSDG